jgi:predicted RNA-binding protein (virulence factor B family)
MLNLGQINKLTVLRQTDNGFYLIDEEENEVLLPNKYIPVGLSIDDELDVFLYTDSEDRPIATTLIPKVQLYGYAYLEVKDVAGFGAFFDWGLEKDLLVPLSQQGRAVNEGEKHVVYLYLDEKTNRLAGTTKIGPTLLKLGVDLKAGDQVKMLPYEESELGFSIIVNDKYQGMLYKNEIFQEVHIGDELTGYVKKIRSDNKIDLSLNRFGYRAVDDNVVKLMDTLKANNGSLQLNDKSSPEAIYAALGMSKKVFKKAVGALYKQKQIEISDTGIKLK